LIMDEFERQVESESENGSVEKIEQMRRWKERQRK
jgi:hypothetical protein